MIQANVVIHYDKVNTPDHPDSEVVQCDKIVVTEKGTNQGLPVVDFRVVTADGRRFYFRTSGRIVNAVSSIVKGVNLRNHGQEEP